MNDLVSEVVRRTGKGDQAGVDELLDRHPELLHARDERGSSLVLVGAYAGHLPLSHHLLARGAEPDIFEAAALGLEDVARRLLREAPEKINATNTDGFQPLTLAAFFGHDPLVTLLLHSGADIQLAAKNAQQVTPLHAAVSRQHERIVARLLGAGANPNARQESDVRPLHQAARDGRIDLVQLLLDAGADPAAQTTAGQTALDFAQVKGHHDTVALLKSHRSGDAE